MNYAMGYLLILVIFGNGMVISYWLKEICKTLRDRKWATINKAVALSGW